LEVANGEIDGAKLPLILRTLTSIGNETQFEDSYSVRLYPKERESFETGMFGWHGGVSSVQTEQITQAKRVIYNGFQQAIGSRIEDKVGVSVDEHFGAAILQDAKALVYHTACRAEKYGQPKFEIEYGDNFPSHIEMFAPTFSKLPALQSRGRFSIESLAGCEIAKDIWVSANRSRSCSNCR
jgi:hypothetical protein